MFSITAGFTVSLIFASQAYAHGYISSPPSRSSSIGDAFSAACGSQLFSQQSSDKAGNIQGEMQVAATVDASECNLWLCKGFKFEDNSANVQSFTAGQSVDFQITIVAPHTGVANVSVVDTASNTVIGEPLISFEDYASTATGVTSDETSFSVTIPEGLDQCSEAGACVLQWYWNAPDVTQTYEDCVDFTIGGSGSTPEPSASASSSEPVPSSASEPVPSSSEPAPSSVSAPATTSEAAPSSAPAPSSVVEPSSASAPSVPSSASSKPIETPSSSVPASSAVPSSSVAVPSTSVAVSSVVPSASTVVTVSPSATPTVSTSASTPAPTSGSCSKDAYNCCMDAYNTCLDGLNRAHTSGGSVDFSSCESERTTCLSGVTRRHAREFFYAF